MGVYLTTFMLLNHLKNKFILLSSFTQIDIKF